MQRRANAAFLTVALSYPQKNEIDRYIYLPGVIGQFSGLQFNPVEISKYDLINFSASVKALDGATKKITFWTRCLLICADGTYYSLIQDNASRGPIGGISITTGVLWRGPYDATTIWDSPPDIATEVGPFPSAMYFDFTNGGGDGWAQIQQVQIGPYWEPGVPFGPGRRRFIV